MKVVSPGASLRRLRGTMRNLSARNCACEHVRPKAARSRCPCTTPANVAMAMSASIPATGYVNAWSRRNSSTSLPSSSIRLMICAGVARQRGAVSDSTPAHASGRVPLRNFWQALFSNSLTQRCLGELCA